MYSVTMKIKKLLEIDYKESQALRPRWTLEY